MRKITKEAIAAFNETRPYSKDNTRVTAKEGESTCMYLFNNEIARVSKQIGLWITTPGMQL